jgi:hypothetical protein
LETIGTVAPDVRNNIIENVKIQQDINTTLLSLNRTSRVESVFKSNRSTNNGQRIGTNSIVVLLSATSVLAGLSGELDATRNGGIKVEPVGVGIVYG